jgi:hypothetical protein
VVAHIQSQLIFDKGTRNAQRRKDSLFNKVLGELDIHMQKNDSGAPPLKSYKNQLKMD